MSDATIQQIFLLKKKKLTPSQIAFVVGEKPSLVSRILSARMLNKPKTYNGKFNSSERENWLI